MVDMEVKARPIAIRLAQEVATISNVSSDGPAFGVLVAELILQNIIIGLVAQNDTPGSTTGEAVITSIYEEIKQTAIKRWHKPDLKNMASISEDQCDPHCQHYQAGMNACCKCNKPLEGESH